MDKERLAAYFEEYRRTGDKSVRDKIAESCNYIAEILAKKFVGRGVEYEDLYQVARLALVKGIDRYDPSLGTQFTTFITPTITGEIRNYFRDSSRLVKVPRGISALSSQVRKKRDELFSATGKVPTPKEIASALAVSEENVVRALEVGNVVSLDAMAREEEQDREYSLYDVLADESNPFDPLEERESLARAVATLSPEEKKLLKYRYGKGMSQEATSAQMGISQMGVSRLERKILQKLRTILEKDD